MGEPWLRSTAILWTALLSFFSPNSGASAEGYKISQPLTHDNLTLYLVHGRSAPGPVPMTLEEALTRQSVRVAEIGSVNALAVENFGDREVFIQSGDIVTGGKQDRVFVSSLVLPPHSGRQILAVFCVEPGRWTARQGTQDGHFVAAAAAMPSPQARTILYEAVAAPPVTDSPVPDAPSGASLQQRMWAQTAEVQSKLSRQLQGSAADPASPTSLALSLDLEKLKVAQKSFVDALAPHGLRDSDVVGYVIAVNGKVSKAEIYASNALFRAMWMKQLRAGAAEAIQAKTSDKTSDKTSEKAAPPSSAAVEKLLDLGSFGKPIEKPLSVSGTEIIREAPRMVFVETRRGDGSFVLRNYLARAS
ncbi:MAG: ARPP-1 family domain-containing protein [Methylovirgula sp.]